MPYPLVKTYQAKNTTTAAPKGKMPPTGAVHPNTSGAKNAVKRPMNTHPDGKPNSIR